MYNRLADVLAGKEGNYMLPFYWQHGDHYNTIPEEIERIYRSGARAFCVESRPHKDFCGEPWWKDMDLILAEAEKRGMKVWILDDKFFPTGHAAGKIAVEHPELRKWQLIERHVDVTGPLKDALLIADQTDENHKLLSVYAYPRVLSREAGEYRCEIPEERCEPAPIDLSDGIDGNFLHFSVPEGCFRIFFLYKSRRGTNHPDYIDMLSSESVRVLIDAVYESHFSHYGKYFGNTLAGFFSDEPSFGNTWFGSSDAEFGIYDYRTGMPYLALPWHDTLIAMMSDTLGFDVTALLPALWFPFGRETEKIRYAYMDAVTKRYRDCFTRQLGDWCKEHSVQYIGHIIEDMNAHARLGYGAGHYFRAQDGQHMGGIDIVLHQIIPGLSDYVHHASIAGNHADPAFFDYVLAKLAASFAHIGTQTEERAVCEVFGAYGWAEGAPMMKWLLDHLLVRGVHYFVPHAFSPSFPDPDCPPHFGAGGKDPQFEGFSVLTTYGNRAAHLLAGGIHKADAAILYHADAEWINERGEAMPTQIPAKILYDAHIDFDILPADCFTENSGGRVYTAVAEHGRLRVGNKRYHCLIVPAAKRLPAHLLQALDALKSAGVPVLRIGDNIGLQELLPALNALFVPDIEIRGEHPMLRCCHYEEKDKEDAEKTTGTDIYMFVNESITETVRTEAALRGIGDTPGVMLDLLNDGAFAITVSGGVLPLCLAPYQSVIVILERNKNSNGGNSNADGKENYSEICPASDSLYELPAKKNWKEAGNAALTFTVEIAPYTNPEQYTIYADNVKSNRLFSITDRSHMPDFSGTIRYTASFRRSDIPPLIESPFAAASSGIAVEFKEVGQTAHLWCNGKDLGVRVCPPYRYDLTEALRGDENEQNTLVITVANTLANALRDPFSAFLALPASGITGKITWLRTSLP